MIRTVMYRRYSFLLIFLLLVGFIAVFTPNVKAYTGTITYSSATNTVTALGGNSSNQITFEDLYLAVANSSLISKQGTCQYSINCKIILGNGSASGSTYFWDSNKQIIFGKDICTGSLQDLILVKAYANLTLGVLENEAEKRTSRGCSIITEEDTTSYRNYIIRCNSDTTGTVNLYSCHLTDSGFATSSHLLGYLSNSSRVWNTILAKNIQFSYGKCDVFNVYVQKVGYAFSTFSGTINRVVGTDLIYFNYIGATGNYTYRNLYIRGNTKICDMYSAGSAFFIDCDIENWGIDWTNGLYIYRQYSWDLSVLNGEITEFVEDANVTLSKGGVQIGSWLTNSSGQIPTQTLTYGFYNKTGGDTLYDGSNPFLLVVTHPDWANYTSRFYVTEKMKMTISMQEQTPEETPNPEEYITIEDGTAYVLLVGLISAVIAAIIAVLLIKKRN